MENPQNIDLSADAWEQPIKRQKRQEKQAATEPVSMGPVAAIKTKPAATEAVSKTETALSSDVSEIELKRLSTMEWQNRKSVAIFFKDLARSRGKVIEQDASYRGGLQLKLKCSGCSGFCIVARKKKSRTVPGTSTFQFIPKHSCFEHFTLDSDNNKVPSCNHCDNNKVPTCDQLPELQSSEPIPIQKWEDTENWRLEVRRGYRDKRFLNSSSFEWQTKSDAEAYFKDFGRERGKQLFKDPSCNGMRIKMRCTGCSEFSIVCRYVQSKLDPDSRTYQVRKTCLRHFSLDSNIEMIPCLGTLHDGLSSAREDSDSDDDDEDDEDDTDADSGEKEKKKKRKRGRKSKQEIAEEEKRAKESSSAKQAKKDLNFYLSLTWPSRADMVGDFKKYAAERGYKLFLDNNYRGGKQMRLKCKGCTGFCITGRMCSAEPRTGRFKLQARNSCFSHFSLDSNDEKVPCLVNSPHPDATLPPAKPKKDRRKIRTPEEQAIWEAKTKAIRHKKAKLQEALQTKEKMREAIRAKNRESSNTIPHLLKSTRMASSKIAKEASKAAAKAEKTKQKVPTKVQKDALVAKEAANAVKLQAAEQRAALKAALLEQKQKRQAASAARQLVALKKAAEKAAKKVTASALVSLPAGTNKEREASRIFAAAVAAAVAAWEAPAEN